MDDLVKGFSFLPSLPSRGLFPEAEVKIWKEGNMEEYIEERSAALIQKLADMGQTAESMVEAATWELSDRSESYQEDMLLREDQIHQVQLEILDRVLGLAKAGRTPALAPRIAAELERIADKSLNIAQISHYLLRAHPATRLVGLRELARVSCRILRAGLDAAVREDRERAKSALGETRKLDILRDQTFFEVLDLMMAEPDNIEGALAWHMILRNTEAIGAHATQILKMVLRAIPDLVPVAEGGERESEDFARG